MSVKKKKGKIGNSRQLLLRVTYFERYYAARLRLQNVQAFQPSGVVLRVSRRGENLALGCRPEDAAAGLRLGLPRGAETLPLHGRVRAELDDHEVRGGHEQFVGELLLAGQGRQVHGLLLRSAPDQDLHYVEAFLRLEFLKLPGKYNFFTHLRNNISRIFTAAIER